jgi:hypothetical protein
VTAGIDLALALVEEDLGRTVALAVARYLVVFLKRPGGQAQFSATLSLQSAEDSFGALHGWIKEHLSDDISLPTLAREAGMSERSQSSLSGGNWADACPCRGTAEGGSGTADAVGVAPTSEAGRNPVRVRLGGDDAAQLSSPARGDAASLPRPVQLLNFALNAALAAAANAVRCRHRDGGYRSPVSGSWRRPTRADGSPELGRTVLPSLSQARHG